MKSLFIIGNGFDLSHGLKTKYEDFCGYLESRYPDQDINSDSIYGGTDFEVKESAEFLKSIVPCGENTTWGDVETALGRIDFEKWKDDVYYTLCEDDNFVVSGENLIKNTENGSLVFQLSKISEHFASWLDNLECHRELAAKSSFARLIGNDSLFLSFNYTDTLEKLYNVDNICHIHGTCGNKLTFGYSCDSTADGDVCGIMRKDSRSALKSFRSFFDKIDKSISRVYSYGFSFSYADRIYIRRICRSLSNHDVIWYFDSSEGGERIEKYSRILIESGFCGRIDTYSV